MLATALGAVVVVSASYQLAAVVAARRFFRRVPRGWPTGARLAPPAISVIVPICGDEVGLGERLEALLSQDYPRYEVLLASLDPDDPGLGTARRVVAAHPDGSVQLVVGGPVHGPNRKVSNLEQAFRRATHEVVAHVDSDMLASRDFLARLVAPLADEAVGVSFALYRGYRPTTVGALLEALTISTEFMPHVFVALALAEPNFGLGASIALRRDVLERLGGYRAFASYINEDHRIAHRATHELGMRAVASGAMLDADAGATGLAAHFARRLRWARTVRAARPLGYAGTILTNATLLATLAAAAVVAAGATAAGAAILVGALAARVAAARTLARRLGDGVSAKLAFLAPVNDLLGAATWAAAHAGRSVSWRNWRYRIGPGGLIEAGSPAGWSSSEADVG